MRHLLNGIHPDLERALDLTDVGPMLLLTRYVAAAELRAAKPEAIARFLRAKGVRAPEDPAEAAHAAARVHPDPDFPVEAVTAGLVREMAEEALACRAQGYRSAVPASSGASLRAAIERKLAELVRSHPDGTLILSLPGMGVVLAAGFLAEAGDVSHFRSAADGFAGQPPSRLTLALVLRQSGKSARLRRPGYANNRLKRVFHQSAFCSLADPLSRAFYDRKWREGKRHHQTVIALARKRIDVLWALLASRKPFDAEHRKAA